MLRIVQNMTFAILPTLNDSPQTLTLPARRENSLRTPFGAHSLKGQVLWARI